MTTPIACPTIIDIADSLLTIHYLQDYREDTFFNKQIDHYHNNL